MSGKTYLITGANRGIGRGMFDHYVAQSHNTIIACVRNIDAATPLLAVPTGANTKIVLAKIDSSSRTDPYDAIKHIQAQGIEHIDVVISSAGIVKLNTVEDVPLAEFEDILMVNAISVMLLYKAVLPLLRRAARPARFAFVSAASGSLAKMQEYPYPNISYTASKVLANSMVVKMGMENEWLITLCIHPGLVATDMGDVAVKAFGLEKADFTLEESSKNTANIIDKATKEEHSEKFFNETIDKIHPW
ncbi:hypothetical protein BDV95DRAFT_574576 [Massariosphaeria phaeospora]|uniref:NAD(P)-binding protein n=1 Tax=Massariosphaeria phaeospora TaxID=100035 RepID=A0A7C8MMZ9_9PLEO|nr:hypothetical protein BDV95DRAFT_574576 [Massariosphaeria phaeospora]